MRDVQIEDPLDDIPDIVHVFEGTGRESVSVPVRIKAHHPSAFFKIPVGESVSVPVRVDLDGVGAPELEVEGRDAASVSVRIELHAIGSVFEIIEWDTVQSGELVDLGAAIRLSHGPFMDPVAVSVVVHFARRAADFHGCERHPVAVSVFVGFDVAHNGVLPG